MLDQGIHSPFRLTVRGMFGLPPGPPIADCRNQRLTDHVDVLRRGTENLELPSLSLSLSRRPFFSSICSPTPENSSPPIPSISFQSSLSSSILFSPTPRTHILSSQWLLHASLPPRWPLSWARLPSRLLALLSEATSRPRSPSVLSQVGSSSTNSWLFHLLAFVFLST
jgi:hypothetical protein